MCVVSGGSNYLVLGEILVFPYLEEVDQRIPRPAQVELVVNCGTFQTDSRHVYEKRLIVEEMKCTNKIYIDFTIC
jgi:hypothetical protein